MHTEYKCTESLVKYNRKFGARRYLQLLSIACNSLPCDVFELRLKLLHKNLQLCVLLLQRLHLH